MTTFTNNKLRRLLKFYIGGGWGKETPYEDFVEGAWVIRGTDIPAASEGTYSKVPFRFHKRSNLEKRLLTDGDIVIEVSGGSKGQPVGRTALIDQSMLSNFGGKLICASFCKLMRPNDNIVDSGFLYYYLQDIYKNGVIDVYQVQSTGISNLQFESFIDEYDFSCPPLPAQRKIASFLSACDKLIENNNRRIKILEEMALAIYKEWFVHFRFPGHENVRKVDSVLGQIPQGWEVKSIRDCVHKYIGGGWGKEEPEGNYLTPAYVIRGTDIPNARGLTVNKCPLRYHSRSNLQSRLLENSDIVMEVSGGSRDQPTGRILQVTRDLLDAFGNGVICASFCKRMTVNRKTIVPELLVAHLNRIYADGSITQYEVQSTGIKNFKFEHFLDAEKLALPDDPNLQQQFRSLILPMIVQAQSLGTKNQNLRKTRDLLLPRLISGRLDVEELDMAG